MAHRSHHLPPYSIFCAFSMRPTFKWHFVLGLPSGSLGIPKVGTPMTLRAHNFACRPLIAMRFQEKEYPS